MALWGHTLGAPDDGKHTGIFQASERMWLSACLELNVFHYLKSNLEAGKLGHACKSMEDLVII